MKNLILIIGVLLIALNSLIGLILSGYSTESFLLSNLSLAISAGIIYFVTCSKMSDGFKIGLASFFVVTGVVRFLCVALAPATWENNLLAIVAAGVLMIEFACIVGAWIASEKSEQG